MLDQPQAVRTGEELAAGPLADFLSHALGGNGPLSVRQFPSGFSNLTYLLDWGGRHLVLRRPPFGANVKSGHDMEREHRVLSLLQPVYGQAPRPVAFCADPSVLGCPFYVMERVAGVILRSGRPGTDGITPAGWRRLSEQLVDNLAALHALDPAATGLAALGRPDGYVQRQVDGWTKRYQAARTDDIPDMEAVAAWLATHRPPERHVGFLHNDYKYDNVVFNEDMTRIKAVLDWEMATVGDPLMDLGTTLGYWTEPADPPLMRTFNVTHLPGNLTRQQVVDRYAEKTGRDLGDALYYFVFGTFKIGAIIQQIYARYRQGHTQDARFARLGEAVSACARTAATALDKDRLSNL